MATIGLDFAFFFVDVGILAGERVGAPAVAAFAL
jgi:hypothetical protein